MFPPSIACRFQIGLMIVFFFGFACYFRVCLPFSCFCCSIRYRYSCRKAWASCGTDERMVCAEKGCVHYFMIYLALILSCFCNLSSNLCLPVLPSLYTQLFVTAKRYSSPCQLVGCQRFLQIDRGHGTFDHLPLLKVWPIFLSTLPWNFSKAKR